MSVTRENKPLFSRNICVLASYASFIAPPLISNLLSFNLSICSERTASPSTPMFENVFNVRSY
ncbi:MAG: hypothetical protein ACK45R_04620, partial [Candidatus Kapaibacterium sp.]